MAFLLRRNIYWREQTFSSHSPLWENPNLLESVSNSRRMLALGLRRGSERLRSTASRRIAQFDKGIRNLVTCPAETNRQHRPEDTGLSFVRLLICHNCAMGSFMLHLMTAFDVVYYGGLIRQNKEQKPKLAHRAFLHLGGDTLAVLSCLFP